MIRTARRTASVLSVVALSAPLDLAAQSVRGIFAQEFRYESPPHPMRLPTAVAIGPEGEVYVLDGVHDRVIAFHSDGQLARVIVPGGEASLRQPVGLCTSADGRLWIADSGNGRIVICGADGVAQRIVPLPATRSGRTADPTGVGVSYDATLMWVTDNDHHRLLRYDMQTDSWREFGAPGQALGQWHHPFHICVTPAGGVVVSDVMNARVQSLGADGTAQRSTGTYGVELGQLFRPGGVAVDREERIWVADSVLGAVQVFHRDGALLDVLRDGAGRPLSFDSPLGLAFDRSGSLYVVETRANRVSKWSVEATPRRAPAPEPARRRAAIGQQAAACTICHLDWIPPFGDGRDSSLMARPTERPGEPIASRSEMCLSCHDGTVADSRRRVWDEHGHRVGVMPPATMTVPAHFPLVDGKLVCRTCHSAHGTDAPHEDFRRTVFLRVPNVASELCRSCHEDKTRGPRFGTHPTGGMPWEIPADLVSAGARVGPNPRELTCQVCHTPHGAKHDHLLVMGTGSNELCLTCHGPMRPGMFREGGEREHPLMPRVNAEQADAVRELGTRLGPQGELVCLTCHKLHDGHGGRFLLAEALTDGQMCLRCHSERREMLGSSHDLRTNVPEERNRLGMTVADGGACSACHLFHRFARPTTPGPGDAAGQCLTCHREGACAGGKPLAAVNHPSPRCTDCHDPHRVRFPSFLRERSDDLCSRCHADQALLTGGAHDSTQWGDRWHAGEGHVGDRCLACHRPHGDERHGLFRVSPVAAQVGSDGACIACHTEAAPGKSLALQHPRSSGGLAGKSGLPLVKQADGPQALACSTCHDPHARSPRGEGLLRTTSAAGGVALCVQCHEDMQQIVVTAHSPSAMRAHAPGTAACGPCHQVHGDARKVSSPWMWPKALFAGDSSRADAYCVGCHRKGGAAEPPIIASHPDVPIFDLRFETGGPSLPLFASDGRPDARGTLACQTCHLPHGRPMPHIPVTAQRSPELRAQRIQLRPFEPPNTCTSCHGMDGLRRFLYFHDPQRRGPTVAR
jgi:predicted CXXCH cytochrome family protein